MPNANEAGRVRDKGREGLKFPKLEDNDTIRVPQNITGSATDASSSFKVPQAL